MLSAPGAFCASRGLPSHHGQTFLLHFVLPANFSGSLCSLCLGNEDRGDVCGHQSDLVSGMLGEDRRGVGVRAAPKPGSAWKSSLRVLPSRAGKRLAAVCQQTRKLFLREQRDGLHGLRLLARISLSFALSVDVINCADRMLCQQQSRKHQKMSQKRYRGCSAWRRGEAAARRAARLASRRTACAGASLQPPLPLTEGQGQGSGEEQYNAGRLPAGSGMALL